MSENCVPAFATAIKKQSDNWNIIERQWRHRQHLLQDKKLERRCFNYLMVSWESPKQSLNEKAQNHSSHVLLIRNCASYKLWYTFGFRITSKIGMWRKLSRVSHVPMASLYICTTTLSSYLAMMELIYWHQSSCFHHFQNGLNSMYIQCPTVNGAQ